MPLACEAGRNNNSNNNLFVPPVGFIQQKISKKTKV